MSPVNNIVEHWEVKPVTIWCDLGKPTTWWNLTYRLWYHIKAGFKPFPNLFLFILSFVCNA